MLQIVRSSMLLGATLFNFLAFQYLQLDQALVIMFSIPLMVAALAGPMLGEWVGPRRWAAIGVGFVGVVLVARPGFGFIHPAALLSVGAAAFSALYAIMTRTLARFDSNETTLFYSNLVGALALLPLMPFVWTTPSDPVHIVMMTFFGALGSGGHFLLIVAHRHTPASILSPFIYTQLIWAMTLGFVVFGDVPDRWTLGRRGDRGRLRTLSRSSRTGARPALNDRRFGSGHPEQDRNQAGVLHRLEEFRRRNGRQEDAGIDERPHHGAGPHLQDVDIAPLRQARQEAGNPGQIAAISVAVHRRGDIFPPAWRRPETRSRRCRRSPPSARSSRAGRRRRRRR